MELFVGDKNETKVFPRVSSCGRYCVYLSGTGKTHTFYKDLVVCQKKGGEWVETSRVSSKIIGYNSTLKNYLI